MGHMKGNDRMQVTSWSFYVGQGTANLIQLAYSGGVKNILIDCGSKGMAEKAPASTAVDKILSMTDKKLHYIIISHTDQDHINMIETLLQQGIEGVEKVIVGGTPPGICSVTDAMIKDAGKKIPSKLRQLFAALKKFGEEKIFFTATGDYATPILCAEEYGQQFAIRLLACRSCMEIKKKTALINSNSVVAVCEYTNSGGYTANICYGGDATVETFDYINKKIDQAVNSNNQTYNKLIGNPNNVLIAPHHAALKTACSKEIISCGTPLDGQLQSAKEFSNKIKACCVYASAYYQTYHWHPCFDILDIYAQNMPGQSSEHNCAGFQMVLGKKRNPEKGYPREYKCTSTTQNKYTSFAFANTFEGMIPVQGGRGGTVNYSYLKANKPEEKLYDFICVLSEEQLLAFTVQDA